MSPAEQSGSDWFEECGQGLSREDRDHGSVKAVFRGDPTSKASYNRPPCNLLGS